jgi:pimeloyl-ACP methyl ester carboxylesterase
LKTVYLISGLGADKTAFSFLDLSFCNPVFINWISPVPEEELEQYAQRLKEQIKDPFPIVIGVSFGGMLATEMAKADTTLKSIIISSNKTYKELPNHLKLGKWLPLYKWLPSFFYKKAHLFFHWFFKPKGQKQEEIFKSILESSDVPFTKWAIEAILKWRNNTTPKNVIHIHGTADWILPYKKVKADYTIDKGTHLMIMNNGEEISRLIKKLINLF